MLESHSGDSDLPSGEESRPECEASCVWPLLVLHVLTQNPGVWWPGLRAGCAPRVGAAPARGFIATKASADETPKDQYSLWSLCDLGLGDIGSSTRARLQCMFGDVVIRETKAFLSEGVSAVPRMTHLGCGMRWFARPLLQQTSLLRWGATFV